MADTRELIKELEGLNLTEQAEKLKSLSRAQLEAIQRSVDASSELVRLAAQQEELAERHLDQLYAEERAIKENVASLKAQLATATDINEQKSIQRALDEELLALAEAKREADEFYMEFVEGIGKETEKQNKALRKQKTVREQILKTAKRNVRAGKALTKTLINSSHYSTGILGTFEDLVGNLADASDSAGGLLGALGGLAGGLGKGILEALIGITLAVDKMESSFRQATGAGKAFAQELTSVYDDTRELGVTVEEANKAYTGLYTTVTDFTNMSTATRKEMGRTVSMLGEYGVSMDDLTSGMQKSIKIFGQSGSGAARTALELNDLALQIGVAPAQMAKDFNAAADSIAKLGADGEVAFKRLAERAKITGMELGKLIKMTEQFDTFEGAATAAGNLNAALGGDFINAMDMMMETDPAARFDSLRGALESAGLEFDTMGYYQRQFIAQSMGLDSVADLAMVMSGNYEALGEETRMTAADYAAQAEKAKEMKDMQEKLNNAMMAMIPILVPFLEWLQNFIEHTLVPFIEKWGEVAVKIGLVLGVLTALSPVIGLVMSLMTIFAIKTGAASIATAVLAAEAPVAAGGMQAMAHSAGMAGQGIIALGIAIGAAGIGIGAAAAGMALLVDSLNEGEDAVENFLVAFTVLMSTMVTFSLLAAAIATSTAVSAPVLSAFGGAIFLIGAGIGIAATGMALFVNSLEGVSEFQLKWGFGLLASEIVIFAAAIGILSLALAKLGTIGAPGVIAFGLLAGGVGLLMSALQEDDNTNYEGMTKLMNAIKPIDLAQVANLRTTFEGMKGAINNTTDSQLDSYRGLFQAAGVMQFTPGGQAFLASFNTGGGGQGTAPPGGATQGARGDSYRVTVPITIGNEKIDEYIITLANGEANRVADDRALDSVLPGQRP